MKTRRSFLFVAWLGLLGGAALAADWPQWQGPNRDGVSKETGLLQEWPKEGPKLLWTYPTAGVGYSGPAVVGDRLYLLGGRDDAEQLLALDVKSGKELWSAKIGPVFTFKGNTWGDGPRATPSVDGERVFALGGQGILICAESATGKERWRVDLVKDLKGEVSPEGGNDWGLGWGYCGAPLVDGEQVIAAPGGKGGTLAAFDKKTGKVLWRSRGLTEPATYSAPIVAEVAGQRQYIYLTDEGLAGVAAKDGKLLWKYQRKPPYNDVVIPTPIFHDNLVFATAGFGMGCDLVKLTADGDKIKAAKVYSNKNLVNREGGVVLVGEHLFGHSEGKGWVCLDFKTGKIVWAERRALGRGSVTFADGRLYCYGEDDGVAVLAEASPEGWKEHGRFEIPQHTKLRKPNGKTWTHPVIANGRLYLREQEFIFCFDVKH